MSHWNYRARAYAAGRRHIRELNRAEAERQKKDSPAPQRSPLPAERVDAASQNSSEVVVADTRTSPASEPISTEESR